MKRKVAKAKAKRKSTAKSNSAGGALKGRPVLEQLGTWLMPQILYRPQRRDYILKIYKPEGCVFCSALNSGKSSETLVVHTGKMASVIMNKFPYNSGHLLIIPNRHCEHIYDLEKDEYAEFTALLPLTLRVLKKSFNAAGFNVGMNLGYAAGAGIPEHLHQHVIPRWVGDANFLPLIAKTKVMIENLDQVYERLCKNFAELT